MQALDFIASDYPGLDLHDRVAIVVPNKDFLDMFIPELEKHIQSKTFEGHQLSLVNTSKASRTVQRDRHVEAGEMWLVVDTVNAFDGLERLIVIAVGLDSVIGGDKTAQTRSELYRAITRAHMLVLVVKELLKDGWLEWLSQLKLAPKEKFVAKQEMEAHANGAAERVLSAAELSQQRRRLQLQQQNVISIEKKNPEEKEHGNGEEEKEKDKQEQYRQAK